MLPLDTVDKLGDWREWGDFRRKANVAVLSTAEQTFDEAHETIPLSADKTNGLRCFDFGQHDETKLKGYTLSM